MRVHEIELLHLRSTFVLKTKRRSYILQFSFKKPWLIPRHEEHYSEADCNLYGWLFIYFGYYN